MAERANGAFISERENIFWSARWGGCSIWEYIIQGKEYSENMMRRRNEPECQLESGCDGAMLIDEIQRNIIFYNNGCGFPVFRVDTTEDEKKKYFELRNKINYFFNLLNDELNPIFVDFLIEFAKISWGNWNVYFARSEDFLEFGKIERDVSKIQSLNYHKTHVHKPYGNYPHEDFPFISEEEILWFLKMHFYDSTNSHHWCAVANINEYERGRHE